MRSLKAKKKDDHNDEKTSEEDDIEGYYCTCKSGKKQAGCIMHVVACIHYLSFARYSHVIKMPGEYLNSVLIDMDTKQSPKKPSYIKNNRIGN
jgi:hypothetical protein